MVVMKELTGGTGGGDGGGGGTSCVGQGEILSYTHCLPGH